MLEVLSFSSATCSSAFVRPSPSYHSHSHSNRRRRFNKKQALQPQLSSNSSSLFAALVRKQTQTHLHVRPHNIKIKIKISAVFERFTERSIKAVIFSQKEARTLGADSVSPQHLFLGLVAEEEEHPFLGVTLQAARDAVRNNNDTSSSTSTAASAVDVPFSATAKRVFADAVDYSNTMRCNFIAPEHIIIALLKSSHISQLLKTLGLDSNQLVSAALSRLHGELAKDGRDPTPAASRNIKKSSSATRPSQKSKDKSMLGQFCVDLTARAVEGLIDPVIARDTEVQRIVQILCRRTKNNPILLGQPGVGKTAIAEGLAISIAERNIPIFLSDKRIMSLDIGLLMAGAKERGELEARVTGLLSEVKKAGDVILFIDEVHTLIGSGTVGKGNKGSGLDIGNLLKPALGRGELQCIASTTIDEHRTHFEKDKALARRFQPVIINEPSQEDAVRILLGLREKYEAHHKCRFTLEAINAAVFLSARYIPDRHLPDKAIDLIDEAGSRACMDAYKRKKEHQTSILTRSPDEYWQEIKAVQTMHEMVSENKLKFSIDNNEVKDSAEMEAQVLSVSEPSTEDNDPVMVGPEDIAAVASLWSGIPVQQLTADERKLLIGLDEHLKNRVIGQNDAVNAISRAVKRSRVGLKDPDRPIAAMLFCGPTGVGKTELTKALADCYFGSESAMLRLDMSEYMERHTVSKMIGSPPGYVGYGEGGTLTEAVRRRPFTVVLLDEIEKAHPDIFNILLQVFEDGHLTDSQGRRVSFKNTLIVMTSNVGSSAISKGKRSIGFTLTEDSESSTYAGMKALVTEELKAYFRPELLNRLDEIVVFRPLEKTQMLEILEVMLEEVKVRLETKNVVVEVSEAVKDLVCEQGYDRSYGARPLRRAVTNIIENVLSEAFLGGVYKEGDKVIVDLDSTGNPYVTPWDKHNVHYSDATSML